jgi:glutathione S-transferase
MADYELFWYPGTCARVSFVALEEIGASFEVNVVDLIAGRSRYSEVNPKGKVPALLSEGKVITENPALLTYLADRHPEARLLPSGAPDLEREVLETMSWFAAGVHPPITRQRFPMHLCDEPAAYESIRARARAQLEACFGIIEGRLDGGEWLFGDWSILDVYLLWLWFRATGSGMPGAQFPNCVDHARRCEARPTVASVLDREEAELARFRAAGSIPDYFPDYQAGRSPDF